MDSLAIIMMIAGSIFAWILPIGITIALVILFKKVNQLEKRLDK
ncbi:hypothetical protein [Planococcus lenghuensis]|nr:hypothetical protein [Planococcus lenghuensis]